MKHLKIFENETNTIFWLYDNYDSDNDVHDYRSKQTLKEAVNISIGDFGFF